jgi:hypothetical protein
MAGEKRVSGPVVITHTKNHKAVALAYPLASRINGDKTAAFGDENDVFGGLGCNGALVRFTPEAAPGYLVATDKTYSFLPSKLYNLEATAFIKNHGDVGAVVTTMFDWRLTLS